MTITLPPELEGPLAEQARRQGTTPEQVAVESLRALFHETAAQPGHGEGTLFDFLAGYVGTIDGSSEPLSENTGRRFTEGLLKKQRLGNL